MARMFRKYQSKLTKLRMYGPTNKGYRNGNSLRAEHPWGKVKLPIMKFPIMLEALLNG
jgi:hypothetical protein